MGENCSIVLEAGLNLDYQPGNPADPAEALGTVKPLEPGLAVFFNLIVLRESGGKSLKYLTHSFIQIIQISCFLNITNFILENLF